MWTAAYDPSVLTVTARPGGVQPFDVTGFSHLLLIDEAGHEHVALADGFKTIRLDVIDGTLLRGPATLQVQLDCTRRSLFSLRTLDSLLRVIGINDGGRRPEPRDTRLPRLIEALRVADALESGASLVEIAAVLTDVDVDDLDWPGEGEHLKSKVRRQVALARRMFAAGPASILAHKI